MTADPTASGEDGSRFRLPVLVLALLSLAAGFADGYALTRFDVFVANQSGNIVRVGMGVVGEYAAWDVALMSMAGFAIGAMIAWAIARWSRPRITLLVRVRLVTVMALVLLWWAAVAGVAGSRTVGLVAALVGAAAMGTMAAVLTHVAGVQAQATYQTATVVRAAQGLLDWAARRDVVHHTGRTLALVSAMTLVCYALGGGLGAVTAGFGPVALLALLLPLLAALALVRPDQ